MEAKTWNRVEGMIIASQLDPQDITNYLTEQNVVAQLDWFKETPNMMGIRVVMDDEHVGLLPSDATEVEPGPKLIDFIEELAGQFKAEVMIGDLGIDRLEGELPETDDEEDDDQPLAVVEISDTPASAVPLMAAFNGIDIVDLELPSGKRALLATLPAGRSNWTLGDVPLVTLTSTGDEFQAFLIEDDDDPESIVTYNWGMEERVIPGGAKGNRVAEDLAQDLVGPRADIEAIHDAVPGVGAELAFAASQQRGALAVKSFVASLGLPSEVADFLRGRRTLEEVGGHLHQARGVSNAIGRSVDIMIGEREPSGGLWDSYTQFVVSKPWAVPLLASAEAAMGLMFLSAGRSRGEKRSAGRKLATFAGVALLIDAVAELSLSRLVILRHQRHEENS
ncbi:hypothetical protein VRY54_00960 [Actinomyces sp. F1_1611]